ncbi:hypothetical protein [Bhargavaea cecembensis]|uniref:hypothetical protein n=1 Tax=Bhargavaea cecembensis TaxID=394098 RepID=UPI0005916E9D|nr:hypothetical protein [Bhargavaea cecembensis]
MKNKAMLAAVGLGAAYLMRNKDSRDKLKKQFNDFSGGGNQNTPKHQSQMNNGKSQSQKKGGLLTSFFD